MKVFKFGGASVKDADSIKNIAAILKYEKAKNIWVVISAMGKMTNAFEKVVHTYIKGDGPENEIEKIADFHFDIMSGLFTKSDPIYDEVNNLLDTLSFFFAQNKNTNYNFIYDQVVCFGELIATKIVSAYFSKTEMGNHWLDARNLIKTDSNFRAARVDWKQTKKNINRHIKKGALTIVQGFIGSNDVNITTTLGREGSDFTAGIFAHCLKAESVTIWKDVEGVLNADPRVFSETTLLKQISYEEAIEMAFYGASVIHPKTIKPLENLEIPLYVRSFIDHKKAGTKVSKGAAIYPVTPCFIVKKNQILVSISSLDFSFMVESNISYIFKQLAAHRLKVNVIQNSAISFSVCIEDHFTNFNTFLEVLKSQYKIDFIKQLTLYTIRHFNEKSKNTILKRGTPVLTQINKETMQIIIKE
ncbi:MAG: aspartate kinase [Flavobacteriaceae bacterium]|nr:MAG: aspartate kinase [Flavobacteriaceae bacterium]